MRKIIKQLIIAAIGGAVIYYGIAGNLPSQLIQYAAIARFVVIVIGAALIYKAKDM